jgi:hypothetical protein
MKILVTRNLSPYGCTINHSARSRSLLYRIRGIRSLLRCKEKPVALNFHLAIRSPSFGTPGPTKKGEGLIVQMQRVSWVRCRGDRGLHE